MSVRPTPQRRLKITRPITGALRNPGFGDDARNYLDKHGIKTASRVPVRSRDFGLVERCRFLYYLTRRLALTPVLSDSEAKSLGGWFHVPLSHCRAPTERLNQIISTEANQSIQKLRERASGMADETVSNAAAQIREDAFTALCWYKASRDIPVPGNALLHQGWAGFLSRYRVLDTEVRIAVRTGDAVDLIQLDVLLYDDATSTLHFFDAKTTRSDTIERAQVVQSDPQMNHYVYVTSTVLDYIISFYKLPKNTKLGSMFHLIIQKPAIRLSGEDRPYSWSSASKRSKLIGYGVRVSTPAPRWRITLFDWVDEQRGANPTKTEELGPSATETDVCERLQALVGTQAKKLYTGEPSFDLYLKRVTSWFHATGDYADEAPKRLRRPVVNLLETPCRFFLDDERSFQRYLRARNLCFQYATCPGTPEQFPDSFAGMQDMGEPTLWAPFYRQPVHTWPTLIAEKHLYQDFPDADLDFTPPILIASSSTK